MKDDGMLLKRFMDDSYDTYQETFETITDAMNLASNYDKKQIRDGVRFELIKQNVTVEEWYILNGTNYTSPTKQISRFANILLRLIEDTEVFRDEE